MPQNKTWPRPVTDFYIGAHAAISHLPVLTRDARRYLSQLLPYSETHLSA
jgi:predicted nucleic acid-binding protein